MKEYIEKETVLNLLEKINPVDFGSMFDYKAHGAVSECLRNIYYEIEDIPAIDATEVKHAKWKYFHKQNKAVCTNCSFERDLDINFGRAVTCPNCGAQMDG